jgi:hypothetical protein
VIADTRWRTPSVCRPYDGVSSGRNVSVRQRSIRATVEILIAAFVNQLMSERAIRRGKNLPAFFIDNASARLVASVGG